MFQNQSMERFAVLRRTLHKSKPSAASGAELGVQRPAERESEGDSASRLGAVLVLFIPLAGVAWVGIGWLVFRLFA